MIDDRPARIADLAQRIERATTFSEVICLLETQRQLRRALAPDLDELARARRGWVFIPPPRAA